MSARRAMAAALLALAAGVPPACAPAPSLEGRDAYIRPAIGGQPVTAAYMVLTSPAGARIVGVSSPKAKAVEMHDIVDTGGGVLAMMRLETLDLRAGETVRFAPGGRHLMVFEPQPLAEGETFPVEFALAGGEVVTIQYVPAASFAPATNN
jgi:hypothetical protein